MHRRWLAALAVVLAPIAAEGVLVVDQQQTGMDLSYPLLEIGGKNDKRLAQTFTVGREGVMHAVELPVQCTNGVLIVEIVRLDGDVPDPIGLLDRGLMTAESLPPIEPLEFRTIPLEELPPAPGDPMPPGSASYRPSPGTRLAIVISNPTGTCTMARGIAIDPYLRGQGFFDERPLPRGWNPLTGNIEPSDDLPFKTIVDADPESPLCEVFGGSPTPRIPAFLPVCRCLADEFLREQRCALLHPSFFLIRRIPWPILPGETFEISWTLTPLTKLAGDLELKESLPKELQGTPKKPLVFRADHVKPGASVTLDYKATALLGKGGTFAIDTAIVPPAMEPWKIRSTIDVEPPPK